MDPPKIIGEYEESVFVNCTNKDDDHYGMQWRAGGESSGEENEKSYVEWNITLSKWNLTAECNVLLNENSGCTKELEITVYRNPETVIISKHASVEGIPYELQCDILNVAPVKNLNVMWYKDNQTIKTDSFNSTTKTPVNQTSTLTVNISRAEHGAQFKCEAQLYFGPDGPRLPVLSDTHHVSVHYAPEFKSKTHTLYVNETSNVTLNCEAEANPPPVFTWTSDGMNVWESTNHLSITQVNTSATYFCTASNYLGNITQEFNVYVLRTFMEEPLEAMTTPEATAKKGCPLTLTPAEVVVKFGDPVSVNCSSSDPDVEMGWEAAVAGVSLTAVPTLTWTVDKLELWAIVPKCYANIDPRVYDDEQCNVMSSITLYKTPDSVSVLELTSPMQEGNKYELTCEIINVAPEKNLVVKWYRDNKMVHTQTYPGNSLTPVNRYSTFNGTAERDHNGALFRCVAELHLGPNGPETPPSVASNYTADVRYTPRMPTNCPGHHTGLEGTFTLDMLSCQADGNPQPTVQWYYRGEPISASERLNRDQSGDYTAELENDLGRYAKHVNIKIEYRPSFTCDRDYTVRAGDKVQMNCDAKGDPKPVITWHKDGKEMATPQHWTRHHSGNYTLEATNKHGTAKHELNLTVLYAPVFEKGNVTKEVATGENVTLDCYAEGYPAPQIKWEYSPAENVESTTRGHQQSISIIEATSTNAGFYMCVATNDLGRVRRSVNLIMKGTGVPGTILWIVIIILSVIIAILLIIVLLKRSKKHGQYSFVPSRANDDSGIPMTSKPGGVHA